jgi:glucose-6-phosphate 1-epimerase
MNIAQLNADHGLNEQLKFVEGKGGFPFIEIRNTKASAIISAYSGQVLSFQPKSEAQDVLFLSDKAYYQTGKAIKGGIPICWPWFGADPEGLGRAAHGFVRNRLWNVVRSLTTDEN